MSANESDERILKQQRTFDAFLRTQSYEIRSGWTNRGLGQYVGEDKDRFPNQLYIHPDECIDCGACEPECPWQAIFEEPAVPEVFKDDVPLNHATVEPRDQFKVATFQKKEHPTPEQVAANKIKWGLDPNS